MLAILQPREMHRMRRSLPAITFVFWLLTAVFDSPPCTSQNPRCALRGVIEDGSGGRIPAAKISARAAESQMERQVLSDARGEFRFDDLQPGTYLVSATAKGFSEVVSDVTVPVSTVRDI